MAQEVEERYISPVARVRSQLSAKSDNEEGEEEAPTPKRQPTKTSTGIASEVSLLDDPVEVWSYNKRCSLAHSSNREGTSYTRSSR